ncbi:hypothetical protein HMPREF1544_04867 [Mucor circinelloides 1006PhL]|uniref:Uncharacterized protein n=1 Tax=Mucor circinelloides f. circinelloides (strain 1006PhL) TaxID=1220926 RepID=S2JZK8_MUCC1|nr:hypothetical protein HMPREF1544_04867 [Mucor circinelloides 1006PhL]
MKILDQPIFKPFELTQYEKEMLEPTLTPYMEMKNLDNSLLADFVRKMYLEFPKNTSLRIMKESQLMKVVQSILGQFFLHDWNGRLDVEGDTFYIEADDQKQNRKSKVDGGLVFRESKQPLLLIEAKRCSHHESKEDFEKLAGLMATVYETYHSNVIGVLVVGDLIIVYILVESSGYKCIVESSRCYLPVSRDDFSRLCMLYLTLTKTTK